MKTRLHLYAHPEPKGRGYIVAEKNALKELSRAINRAVNGSVGLEVITFYGSDGHEYELALVCDVSEEEWQDLPVPSNKDSDPGKLTIVQTFDELKTSI